MKLALSFLAGLVFGTALWAGSHYVINLVVYGQLYSCRHALDLMVGRGQ